MHQSNVGGQNLAGNRRLLIVESAAVRKLLTGQDKGKQSLSGVMKSNESNNFTLILVHSQMVYEHGIVFAQT